MLLLLLLLHGDYLRVEARLEALRTGSKLSDDEWLDLLRRTHGLLAGDTHEYNLGLRAICYAADSFTQDTDVMVRQLLYDCIDRSRIHIYSTMLEEMKGSDVFRGLHQPTFEDVGIAYYTLDEGNVLTKDQRDVYDAFQAKRRLVVSAPTSFGKSKIICDIIEHSDYSRMVIIQPTRALLSETYIRLRQLQAKRAPLRKYTILSSIAGLTEIPDRCIFVLTPERLDLLMDQFPLLKFDFFVLDEAYKVNDKDDRQPVFAYCLHRLAKQNADFYIIGPYFRSVGSGFIQATNADFRHYSTEVVQKEVTRVHGIVGQPYRVNGKELKACKGRDTNLRRILRALDREPALVYVAQQRAAESCARLICSQRSEVRKNELAEHVRRTVAKDWSLADCLEKGVAFHHGAMPRYIQHEIVAQFEEGQIDCIVCTPTLTEGVNTTAKCVVVRDGLKGKTRLSGFDILNIEGRAGRFRKHFVGQVYILSPVGQPNERERLEVPYFDPTQLSEDEAIMIERSELPAPEVAAHDRALARLQECDIPLPVVTRNRFVPLLGQIELVKHLRGDPSILGRLVFAGQFPTYHQTREITTLCIRYLFSERDRDKKFTERQLAHLASWYVCNEMTIPGLIDMQRAASTDTKVRRAFSLMTKHFEFAFPKTLRAFQNLYNFVYAERLHRFDVLNLGTVLTKLEYGFLDHHKIALKDAGVPPEIITKVGHHFEGMQTIAEIRAAMLDNPSLIRTLSEFERKLFSRYV